MDPSSDNTAALAASMQTLNNMANIAHSGNLNRKNIALAREMNQKQREDSYIAAIAQRKWAKEDWDKTAKYNSPEQQMARLKEAGLNPHLVYGNGADAQVGDMRGTNISTPNYDTPKHEMFDLNVGNPLMEYIDLQARGQTSNNLSVMEEVYKAQAEKIRTETLVEAQNLKDKSLAYEIQLEVRDSTVAYQGLRNDKIKSDIDTQMFYKKLATSKFSLEKLRVDIEQSKLKLQKAKTEREMDVMLSTIIQNNIENANTRMDTKEIQAHIRNMNLDAQLTAIHIQLRKLGLTPGTPEYVNRYTQMAQPILKGLSGY